MRNKINIKVLAAAMLLLPLGACGLVYDNSECADSANVFEFRYDRNLKFADAFPHEVKAVTLLAFDGNGVLAYAGRAEATDSQAAPNTMDVHLQPGEYDVLVWGGDYDSDYSIPRPVVGQSRISDFDCVLRPGASGHRMENLYHSLNHFKLDYSSPSNPNRHVIDLTKDTNNLRVMLQQQGSQGDIGASAFTFEITDNNRTLRYDNSLKGDTVTYTPWAVTEGATSYGQQETRAQQALNTVLAEFTLNRLTPGNETKLTVRRSDTGEKILEFPVIDYALMLKGEFRKDMADEDFLDRQDDYSLTFVLDQDQRWMSVVITINDWRIIRHNTPVK